MDRRQVILIARRHGWTQCGQFHRYGPDWYECYRRGRQFIWIGMDYVCSQPNDVKSGLHRDPLHIESVTVRQAKLWFK